MPRGRAHRGWTEAHVRRVFWRAGFGATPREARHWARRGKGATIRWLLNGGPSPAPRIKPPRVDGHRLDPENEWGHDVLWWLDRMVRSRHPLQEKLTLFWHDHFATTDQDTPLMLAQNRTLRRHALGRFPDLLQAVTRDPAMLLFLSLANSDQEAPNENYARELMELFTLGRGYTERDIRQAARALTGFRADWRDDGSVRTSYDREWHDGGAKRMLGKVGRFDWKDVLHLCVHHPAHAPFMVGKLWDFFVGVPLRGSTRAHLVAHLPPLRLPHPPGGRRDPRPARRSTGTSTRPTWSSRPVVFVAGALRSVRPGHRARRLDLAARGDGPVPVPAALGGGLGVGHQLALVELDAGALRLRQLHARHPPRRREGRLDARLAVAAQGGRAGAARGRRPVDLGAHRSRAAAHRRAACSPTRTSTSAATCASACCATC